MASGTFNKIKTVKNVMFCNIYLEIPKCVLTIDEKQFKSLKSINVIIKDETMSCIFMVSRHSTIQVLQQVDGREL